MVQKKSISITVEEGQPLKIYGKANQIRAFFGSSSSSIRPKERAVYPASILSICNSYEEGLGRRFRDLERGIALRWWPKAADLAEDEDELGNTKESKERAPSDGKCEICLTPKVGYEEGLGSKFRDLQMGHSRGNVETGLSATAQAQGSAGIELSMTDEEERDGQAAAVDDMALATATGAKDLPCSPTSVVIMDETVDIEKEVISNEDEWVSKLERKEEESDLPSIVAVSYDASDDNSPVSSSGSSDVWEDVEVESNTQQEDIHVQMGSNMGLNKETNIEIDFYDQIDCLGGKTIKL